MQLTLFSLLIALIIPLQAVAAETTPIELEQVGIHERLGEQVPADLTFTDESGKTVRLGDYFDGTHPVILTLVYYECPNLCNLLLNGMVAGMKGMPWTPGDQFRIVSVSIDPRETPSLAAQKKAGYLADYGRPQGAAGWSFLTGSEERIRALADAVGFHYRYDDEQKQFAHAAALFILTPDGRLSRMLPGIMFEPRDLKLALLEASRGKIGNVLDRLLLYCYHYDPQGRKYAVFAQNVMKLAGLATIVVLGALLFVLSRSKGNNRSNKERKTDVHAGPL